MFNKYQFKSVFDLLKIFPDEVSCITYLEKLRWKDSEVISPFAPNGKVYKLANNRYKCRASNKYFNAKTNTIFEGSKIPLQKWFLAIYLFTSHKKGVSSYQLARDLDITQKSSWFMLQRIRHAMDDDILMLEDNVQIDETFVGGKNKNRHFDKKVEQSQGRSFKDKTPVLGIVQAKETETIERQHKVQPEKIVKETIIIKDSKVICHVIPNTQKEVIQPILLKQIPKGANVMTDEWKAYKGLDKYYNHSVADHSKKQYVSETGGTTNAIENFWTHFKRGWCSTYSGRITPKHLQKYVDEFSFRYNNKEETTAQRFNVLLQKTWGKRLTYNRLIA